MALDPRKRKDKDKKKKKKKESPQTHVKRSQASRRRIRHKGEFAPGGLSKLHNIFHSAAQIHGSVHLARRGPGKPDIDDIKIQAAVGGQQNAGPTMSVKGKAQDKAEASAKKRRADKQKSVQSKGAKAAAAGVSQGEKIENPERVHWSARDTFEPEEAITEDDTSRASPRATGMRAKNEQLPLFGQPQADRSKAKTSTSTSGGSGRKSNSGRSYVLDENDPDSLDNPQKFELMTPQERRRGAGQGYNYGEPDVTAQTQAGTDQENTMGQEEDLSMSDQGGERPIGPNNVRLSEIQMTHYRDMYGWLISRGDHTNKQAQDIAVKYAADITGTAEGVRVKPSEMRRKLNEDVVTTRREDPQALAARVESDELWRTHRGTLPYDRRPDSETPIEMVRGRTRDISERIYERLPDSEKSFVDDQFGDAFKGNPDKMSDLKDYLSLRQDGYGANEIMMWMEQGKPETARTNAKTSKQISTDTDLTQMAHDEITDRKQGVSDNYSKDKYASGQGKHSKFGYSMQTPGVPELESLRKRFPDASQADLLEYHKKLNDQVDQYMLEANERWMHETRQARVAGKRSANLDSEDRVVLFTTNLGAPAANVPANSTIGQYIIKKRKKMVVDEKMATRNQVKGEFPRAVRDQHLIEVGTGLSLGVEGRLGAFSNTGWRKGTKRSKGYGKRTPLGGQILRNSAGQPIYDKDGNVRYTQGYTRPFSYGSDRDVGLRVFIG